MPASDRIDSLGAQRRCCFWRGEKADQRFAHVHLLRRTAQGGGKADARLQLMRDGADQLYAGGGAGAFSTGGLLDMWRNREERNFRIVLPDEDATEWDFVGAISRFQPGEIGLENIVTATVEITPLSDSTQFLP